MAAARHQQIGLFRGEHGGFQIDAGDRSPRTLADARIVERDGKLRGEFTLVVAPMDEATLKEKDELAAADAEVAAAAEVRVRLAAGMRLSKAAKEVAAEFGVPRSKVYAEALLYKKEAE